MKRHVVRKGYINQTQKSVQIHISELQLGMFVSKLDRPWIETPFLFQGFVIEHLDDIEVLSQYCEHVWVDALAEEWIAPEERAIGKPPKSRYVNKIPAQDEHKQALGLYKEARKITKSLLDDVRLGRALDTRQAEGFVSNCVDSVLRNPDALMWMSKMRGEDEYTTEHCINVCILAVAFGRNLDMSQESLFNLGLCGLLHDVGKLKIPNAILNKPSALTNKERKIIQAHVVHGRNLLMSTPNIYDGTIDVAYSHHERIDGKGYPRKLKGAAISQYARMIAIVDAYDAMTTERCYAPALESTTALKIIYKDRGTHFDEHLAIRFIETVGLYPPGSIVELANGAVGLSLSANQRYSHLPSILVLLDENKNKVKEHIINLGLIVDKKLGKEYLIKKVLKDGAFNIRIKDYQEHCIQFQSHS